MKFPFIMVIKVINIDIQECIEIACPYFGGPDLKNYPDNMYCFKAKEWLIKMKKCPKCGYDPEGHYKEQRTTEGV